MNGGIQTQLEVLTIKEISFIIKSRGYSKGEQK